MARESFGKGNPTGKRATLVVQKQNFTVMTRFFTPCRLGAVFESILEESDRIKLQCRKVQSLL
jgi:hypothetical protein